MAEHAALSARVSKDLPRRLTALARATRRSKSELMTQAIEDFVALQEWQIQAIEEGIADAEAGNFVSHEGVCEKLGRWGKERSFGGRAAPIATRTRRAAALQRTIPRYPATSLCRIVKE